MSHLCQDKASHIPGMCHRFDLPGAAEAVAAWQTAVGGALTMTSCEGEDRHKKSDRAPTPAVKQQQQQNTHNTAASATDNSFSAELHPSPDCDGYQHQLSSPHHTLGFCA